MSPPVLTLEAEPTGAKADGRQRRTSTGWPVSYPDSARIVSALAGYKDSQSGYVTLPEPARHAVLEIGDRMQGLRDALRPAEPNRGGDPATDARSESLVASALRDAVDPYLDVLSREIGFAAPASWRAASRYFHDRFGALIDLSPVAVRCYRKPLGYAGDFEMMNMLYRNQSLGDTLFGRSLSRFLLDSDAGQAVRHRAPYLVGKITAAAGRGGPDRPAHLVRGRRASDGTPADTADRPGATANRTRRNHAARPGRQCAQSRARADRGRCGAGRRARSKAP